MPGSGTGTPITPVLPSPSTAVAYAGPALPITLLSLTQFAQILGLDPLHFFGGISTLRPESAHCHDVWMEYQWQDTGKASRAEVARAIHRAEDDIADVAGFWPAWKWIADERHQCRRGGQSPHVPRLRFVTKWGKVISGGAMTSTEAILASSIVRGANIDTDGDGFAETAVFTLSGVSADWGLEEIRACFKEYSDGDAANCRTDPTSTDFDENWEVRPIRMKRSGTTVLAYVPIWLLFKPRLYEALDADNINADDVDNYVDTVSFYRVYNDLSTQASLMWGTDCVYDVSCAWTTQAGCIRTPDPHNGIITVTPGTYDADNDVYDAGCYTYGTTPDAVRLWYKAGLPRPAPGVVDHTWARLIVMLACARLDWPVCSCSNVKTLVDEWKQNAAKITEDRTYTFPVEAMLNPFGMRVGEILAYIGVSTPGRKKGRAVRT